MKLLVPVFSMLFSAQLLSSEALADKKPCYEEHVKVIDYEAQLKLAEYDLEQCQEAQKENPSKSCWWDVRKVKHYKKKLEKWTEKERVCLEYHKDLEV